MTIPDVNVLLYAADHASVHHEKANEWLTDAVNGAETIGLHPFICAAFLRISTNHRAMAIPFPLESGLAFIDALMNIRGVRVLGESSQFWETFTSLLTTYHVVGPSVADMYIAALAIDNDATLCSADQGFGRIKELRWRNLLA